MMIIRLFIIIAIGSGCDMPMYVWRLTCLWVVGRGRESDENEKNRSDGGSRGGERGRGRGGSRGAYGNERGHRVNM